MMTDSAANRWIDLDEDGIDGIGGISNDRQQRRQNDTMTTQN